jgi:hypothetical protein
MRTRPPAASTRVTTLSRAVLLIFLTKITTSRASGCQTRCQLKATAASALSCVAAASWDTASRLGGSESSLGPWETGGRLKEARPERPEDAGVETEELPNRSTDALDEVGCKRSGESTGAVVLVGRSSPPRRSIPLLGPGAWVMGDMEG